MFAHIPGPSPSWGVFGSLVAMAIPIVVPFLILGLILLTLGLIREGFTRYRNWREDQRLARLERLPGSLRK